MKVCVIGNSHVGALRQGWMRLSTDFPDTNITFFASPQKDMHSLEMHEGNLVSRMPRAVRSMKYTSGGQDRIAVDQYDAFAISLGIGIKALMQVFRVHRSRAMPSSGHLISDEFALASVYDSISKSAATRIARAIRARTASPIIIIETPLPNRLILKKSPRSAWPEAAKMVPVLKTLLDPAVDKISGNLSLIYHPQPRETIKHGFTLDEYSIGSKRLSSRETEHAPDEPHHMNANYGRVVLKEMLAAYL